MRIVPLLSGLYQTCYITPTRSLAPYRNRGEAILSPSMQMVGQSDAIAHWWHEIDAAGIGAAASVGRLSVDRGSIDATTLSELQQRYPKRFYGLAQSMQSHFLR